MPKRMFALGAVFLTLAILPATRCAAQASSGDVLVNHFLTAVRDGDFSAATKHFKV